MTAVARDGTDRPTRSAAIDVLRGIVIMLMTLDHTRDFFSSVSFEPTDLAQTTPALFLTRWITHFCAPIFVLLAGTSAYLGAPKTATPAGKGRVSGMGPYVRYLALRGLWLILLEVTWVRFGWTFNINYHMTGLLVIWAIGVAMIALAALVHFSPKIVGIVGVVIITMHNLLDPIKASDWGSAAPLWKILHEPGAFQLMPGIRLAALYSVLPWIGVMCAGYGFGALWDYWSNRRTRSLLVLGGALSLAFVIVRGLRIYGDPEPWSVQGSSLMTALSFLNTNKYPPSLAYLLMTLGPAMLGLGLLSARPRLPKVFSVFGRVPMFFYLLHLPLIHLAAVVTSSITHGTALWGGPAKPPGFGFGLGGVYLVTALILAVLYPICLWFATQKSQHRGKLIWRLL